MVEDTLATIHQRLLRQRSVLLALEPSPSRRDRLANVEAALQWLLEGAYGRCSVCGARLEADVLASEPATTVCKPCRRPIGRRRRPHGRSPISIRPGELGLVSIEDDDEVRQIQFEAASRLAAWIS